GHWREEEGNFTFDLLRLISAEQEDNSLGGPDTDLTIGRLFNHLAWPRDAEVTPRIEAQWIHCCRIVRISQAMAGIAEAARTAGMPGPGAPERPEEDAEARDRAERNAAITLS